MSDQQTEKVTRAAAPPMPVRRIDAPRDFCLGSATMRELNERRDELGVWKAGADAAHAANAQAILHNNEQSQAVNKFMSALGIAPYYIRDAASRARFPKMIRREPGYIEDLNRTFTESDGYESAVRKYQDMLRSVSARQDEVAREQRALAAARDKANKERESLIELGKMCAKYSVTAEDWRDMLGQLRARDRYLDLAVGCMMTRNDWSSGPEYAEEAIRDFVPETELDKAILADLEACLEDFCDGRVFRDTEYSYDYLFGLVPAELMADARVAMDHALY